MQPEGQSFPVSEPLLGRGLCASELALSQARHRAGLPIGWMALLGASVIFKYQPFSLSARSCAPSKKRGPMATVSLVPASQGICSAQLGVGWAGTPGPLPVSSWHGVFGTFFAPGATAVPWKGTFFLCRERYDQSGKKKRARRSPYPPPVLKIQHMPFISSFCTNPVA